MVFRFGEKVDGLKKGAIGKWSEIPVEAMELFAGEILASGVVLWALMNQTGLDAMRWPGDLPVVLGLKIKSGSEFKIGQTLNLISESVGLMGAESDTMQSLFLELLKWNVVEQLQASLFNVQKQQLAQIMKAENFSVADRSKMLDLMQKFLQDAGIFAFDAQNYFEIALKKSLVEVYEEFESLISPEKKSEILKYIS